LTRTGHGRAADWWSLGAILYEMVVGMPPFYSRQRERLFQKILSSSLRLPRSLSPECRHLLLSLLDRNPLTRIGSRHDAMELKIHPFFHDIDWDALAEKRLQPPFRPHISQQTDTDNFDVEFTSLPLHSHDKDTDTHDHNTLLSSTATHPALSHSQAAATHAVEGQHPLQPQPSNGVESADVGGVAVRFGDEEEVDEEESSEELDGGQFANFTFVAPEGEGGFLQEQLSHMHTA
jgi:serine/threonine protein kinase